jgi:hypothetical protein
MLLAAKEIMRVLLELLTREMALTAALVQLAALVVLAGL